MGKMHGLRCWICGKKKVIGRQVSHSGVRTPRVFKPNLQWKRMVMNGKMVRMRICTKCLKRLRREEKSVKSEAPVPKQQANVA